MGSMITLGIGNLEVDWGKNWGFRDHRALFQTGDVALVDYHYWGGEGAIVENPGSACRGRLSPPNLSVLALRDVLQVAIGEVGGDLDPER